jgi:hypothetical protein
MASAIRALAWRAATAEERAKLERAKLVSTISGRNAPT